MSPTLTNWTGNITFSTDRLERPRTVEELQHAVGAAETVRALGSGHSFNRIADSTGMLVTTADLPPSVEVAEDGNSARVMAGMRYGAVAEALCSKGFGLHNLGSLPHISVAGACSTGTHGSGDTNGSLAGAVRRVELVTADGSLRTVSRGEADFPGSVLALGCLGIVTHLTLDIEPAYEIEQHVYLDLPRRELHDAFPDIMADAYSVSVFLDWESELIDHVWLKRRTGGRPLGATWHGARAATSPMHPIRSLPGDEATVQGGVAGPWHLRLPHFRMEYTPSNGDELQSEYFVDRSLAVDAIRAVESVAGMLKPVLLISELRTVKADQMWLSPAYQRESAALHFTWVNDPPAVLPVVAALEAALEPYDARPHWGKVFTTSPDRVRELLPRVDDFRHLRAVADPDGKFGNEFVDRYVGAKPS